MMITNAMNVKEIRRRRRGLQMLLQWRLSSSVEENQLSLNINPNLKLKFVET